MRQNPEIICKSGEESFGVERDVSGSRGGLIWHLNGRDGEDWPVRLWRLVGSCPCGDKTASRMVHPDLAGVVGKDHKEL